MAIIRIMGLEPTDLDALESKLPRFPIDMWDGEDRDGNREMFVALLPVTTCGRTRLMVFF